MEELDLDPLKIKNLVIEALCQAFNNDELKIKVYSYKDRLNFSCPYCGDSSNSRKKRGNLYLKTLTYKCYNGGCDVFKDFISFLKDFKLINKLTGSEIDVARIAAQNIRSRSTRSHIDVFLLDAYKDVIIERDLLKASLNLQECNIGSIADYLKSRHQIIDEKFLYDPIRRNLYLLNLTLDGKYCLGLQRRSMRGNNPNKYLTYKLSGIYTDLLKIKDPDKIKKAEEIDPISTVFGFSFVNLDSMITVFEGPFDAWLCPNSIALCSINNPFPFDITNKRYLYDGDKTGRSKMKDLLMEGETVFLWEKFISENNLPEREKWDLNDIVKYCRDNSKKIKRLEDYFSSSRWDIMFI